MNSEDVGPPAKTGSSCDPPVVDPELGIEQLIASCNNSTISGRFFFAASAKGFDLLCEKFENSSKKKFGKFLSKIKLEIPKL